MQPETSIFRVDGLTWEDLESMIRCMSPDMKKEKVLIDTCDRDNFLVVVSMRPSQYTYALTLES